MSHPGQGGGRGSRVTSYVPSEGTQVVSHPGGGENGTSKWHRVGVGAGVAWDIGELWPAGDVCHHRGPTFTDVPTNSGNGNIGVPAASAP